MVTQLENYGWGDNSFETRLIRAGAPDSPQLAQARYVLISLRQIQALAAQLRFNPPPPPPEEPPPPPFPPSQIDLSSFPAGGSQTEQMAWCQRIFEEEVAGGRFDPQREQALRDLMNRLGGVLQGQEDRQPVEDDKDLVVRKQELLKQMQDVATVRVLADDLRSMAKDIRVKTVELPVHSRAKRVMELFSDLKDVVIGELNTSGLSEPVQRFLNDSFAGIARLSKQIGEQGADDEKLVRIERDLARNLAYRLREYGRRSHLLLASPVWGGAVVKPDVNFLAFAGPARVGGLVRAVASQIGLTVSPEVEAGVDSARGRWNALQRSSVAVFDLSERDPDVFYQLGIAYTLGLGVLLLSRQEVKLPFDIAQDVVRYSSERELREQLPAWLDRLMYGLQTRAARLDQQRTLAACRRLAPTSMNLRDQLLEQLRLAAGDAESFAAVLVLFLQQLHHPNLRVLRPRWPAFYPDPAQPRGFLVMPFDPNLSNTQAMRHAIEGRLREVGVTPVRGDVAEGDEIIQSIWEETTRATHVFVDLTGYNLNVCLELGVADTLGRPTFLFGCEGTEKKPFRCIEKRRIHIYEDKLLESAAFAPALDRFIKANLGG